MTKRQVFADPPPGYTYLSGEPKNTTVQQQQSRANTMTDAAWIKKISKIKDPKEACRTLAENENFLGYDPYYRDLRVALIAMCERCGK